MTPSYLKDILPTLVSTVTPYNLRNADDYTIPNNRLQTSNLSFIPSTVRLWNDLDNTIKTSPTFNTFKYNLRKNDERFKVPNFYLVGDRKSNILLTRLRHKCSTLNDDLFHVNLIDSPNCACGYPNENSYHFFFMCSRFTNQRLIMFINLQKYFPLNLENLLFGNENNSSNENEELFIHVQQFISSTSRFN